MYEFRGESYVHGVMDGEDLVNARGRRDQEKSPQDNMWLDELGVGPWPFDVEDVDLA